MKALLIIALPLLAASAVADTPTIRQEQLSIAGVSLGNNEEQVRSVLGEPKEAKDVRAESPSSPPERELQFEGLRVYFVGNEVHNVRCTASTHATSDGVRVGNPANRIVEVYGQPEIVSRADDELHRFQVNGTDTYLLFIIRRGKIAAIELWFDWT